MLLYLQLFHTHTSWVANTFATGQGFTQTRTSTSGTSGSTGGGGAHDHTLSANFTGGADSVLQPFLVLIYIIKT